ncbi:MAG: cob(I)yrinic acid a,c-diamide adenosyltransferase [Chloroflexi bacterium]|nr:cob(I)yrinic acid a,c-diamide adenosyltransferase [Chloroflexota bacterium]
MQNELKDIREQLGLVQVYTGEGKGKTTATLGLALRASGYGLKVIIVQFLKGQRELGEHQAAAKSGLFDIIQPGLITCLEGQNTEATREASKKALEISQEKIKECDVLICDEFNIAVKKGYITIEEALNFIKNKPAHTELVLSGRYAAPEIIELANLVSVITPLKHYSSQGQRARKGIEF